MSALRAVVRRVASAVGVVAARPGGERERVVVLGCGWGGYHLARGVDTRRAELTVVSDRNHFIFTPLLASTTVGTLEFRCIVEPVRTAQRGIRYFQASCEGVDVARQVVLCRKYASEERGTFTDTVFEMPYDRLVIASGAVPNTFGIPGVREHATFLKSLQDARFIRGRLLECFERAAEPDTSDEERRRLLRFVVVGGGPTSVETAAEIYDFVKQDVRRWYADMEQFVSIALLESSDHILGSFDRSLSSYAEALFRKREIDTMLNTRVTRVAERELHLHDGRTLPFGLCVWSTGVTASPFVRSLPFRKSRSGRLLTDAYLRVVDPETGRALHNVHAIGDCATPAAPDGGAPQHEMPCTAQVAAQSGIFVTKVLNRILRETTTADGLANADGSVDSGTGLPMRSDGRPDVAPFKFRNRGSLAYVGSYRALADLPQGKLAGWTSWLFWRSAYLTMLLSVQNKILVPMFWLKSYVFGRDVARF